MMCRTRLLVLACLFFATVAWAAGPQVKPQPPEKDILFNTFSLVAFDPDAKEWGVVVTTAVTNVGKAVPWAKAGVGAVATQASTNKSFGPKGLELLAKGMSVEEVAKALKDSDPKIEVRQFGLVDAKGNSFSFTGKNCQPWAGHKTGKNYACQGNLLAGEAVVNNMAKTFEETKGSLAVRFMAALEAGQKEGGDNRNKKTDKQSAAMLIVHDNSAGKGGPEDRVIDIQIDNHKAPVAELARLLAEKLKKK